MIARSKFLMVLIFLLGLGAGLYSGYGIGQGETNDPLTAIDRSYPADYPITLVYGFVRSVGSDRLTLEYDTAQFSVSGASNKVRKTVFVSDDTVIQKTVNKPPEEALDFLDLPPGGGAAAGTEGDTLELPDFDDFSYSLEDVSLSDIKGGDYVEVNADNDIQKNNSFSAFKIRILNLDYLPEGAEFSVQNLPGGSAYSITP